MMKMMQHQENAFMSKLAINDVRFRDLKDSYDDNGCNIIKEDCNIDVKALVSRPKTSVSLTIQGLKDVLD